MTSHVLIVGGGLAGLSAAAALAERGVSITLLESRPRLGGRAGSFRDSQTGEWIDTCQHVGMGCCTNLLHFCRMVGIEGLFHEERELTFIGPAGERCRFRAGRAPAPLHLAPALMKLRFLTSSEKLRLALDLRTLSQPRWATAGDMSFAEWLQAHSRTAYLRQRFWDVILVSALSETAERIAVPFARQVFVDGFLANRSGWRMHVPTVPLDELYGQHVTHWLKARGATVRTQAGVERLEAHEGRVVSARLRSGERIEADEFIVAVPWHRVLDLLPPALSEHPQLAGIRQFESAPISSVHLWFDRPVIDVPHAVLVGRLSQWVFARAGGEVRVESPESRVQCPEEGAESREVRGESREVRDASQARRGASGEAGGDRQALHGVDYVVSVCESAKANPDTHPATRSIPPSPLDTGHWTLDSGLSTLDSQRSYLQVVISASREVTAKRQAETVDVVVGELAEIWPQVSQAKLVRSRMVTEHRAVFSPLPGVENLRPPQQSPIRNLQLAGDWTRTQWPATMESAVRSGFLAAENVLRRMGREESLVLPKLPVGRLSRWLFGLEDIASR